MSGTENSSEENGVCFDEISQELIETIPDIKTLEIISDGSPKVTYNIADESDYNTVELFSNIFKNKPRSSENLQNLNVFYQGLEYIYFMEDFSSEPFILYGWLSKELQAGKKRGLVALGYEEENVIFLATCDIDKVRTLTSKIVTVVNDFIM